MGDFMTETTFIAMEGEELRVLRQRWFGVSMIGLPFSDPLTFEVQHHYIKGST
jgi:hypothetical protein